MLHGMHKLSPPWEGPFVVSRALHNDSYYLVDAQEARKVVMDKAGEETKRPWNVALLRPFYTWKAQCMYLNFFYQWSFGTPRCYSGTACPELSFILTCMSVPSGGTRGLPRFIPVFFLLSFYACRQPREEPGDCLIYIFGFSVCRASSEIDFLVGVMYVM